VNSRTISVWLVSVLVIGGFSGILIPVDHVRAAGPTYVSGTISSDTTWDLANSSYIVTGDVTVDPGITLTIEPGVEVRFDSTFSIIVDGKLIADGTSANPIRFTSNQSVPTKGDWYTIRLRTDNNLIDNAEIEYATYGVFLTFFGTGSTVSNTTITNCKNDGVYITNSDNNLISNVTSSQNDRFGITIYESYGTRIENSTVQYNNFFGINLNASTFTEIYDTNISYNDGKGILFYSNSHNTTISGCQIDWNNHNGIDLSGTSDNDIFNTTVIGNNGIGIDFGGVTINQWIENTTVVYNEDTGIDLRGSSYAHIVGCNVSWNKGHGGIYSGEPVEVINITKTKVMNNSVGHGIDLFETNWVNITDSNISGNVGNGIFFNISFIHSNNRIQNCTIARNDQNGIYFYKEDTDPQYQQIKYNKICYNKIYLNGQNGIHLFTEYGSTYFQYNSIYFNTIHSNNKTGIIIYTQRGYSYVQYNNIYSNIIHSHNQHGIYMYERQRSFYIQDNNIYSNEIYFNAQNGIYFQSDVYSYSMKIENNNLYMNTIYSNKQNGIYFHSASPRTYIENNDIYSNIIYLIGQSGINLNIGSYYESRVQNNNIHSNTIYQHSEFNSSFGDAVDNNELYFVTHGDALWFEDNATFFYDGDSVRCGNLSNPSEKSYLETMVAGPGVLKFYWKVSGYSIDNYEFYIDDQWMAQIEGEMDWQQGIVNIGSGLHKLTWVYNKNNWPITGSNCGWLDKVEFTGFSPISGIMLNAQYPTGTWQESDIYNNTISYYKNGIILSNINSHIIYANNISYNDQGIFLSESTFNTFHNNNITYNNGTGINITYSSTNNIFENNNISNNNKTGIQITEDSNDNFITRNNITENLETGINITDASGNQIHHNNFINNTQNAYDSTIALNDWDDGAEGNYWSDYLGTDDNGDGFGEDPYVILGGGSRDWHPFVFEVDVTPPFVLLTSPFDGEKNVPINTDIIITFSKGMNKTSVESAISISGGLTPTNFVWDPLNETVTFTPSSNLQSRTEYTVTITTEAKDPLGNRLKITYIFKFWSEDIEAPRIILTSPFDAQLDVGLNANVIVTFNEPMNTTSVTYACTPDPFGWIITWNGNFTVVTFSHNNFGNEATYDFQILTAKDVAGLDLIPGLVPNPFTFTTKDILGPEIVSTSPVDGSENVSSNANIVVSFNKEMDLATVSFSCFPDPLGWFVSWSNDNKTATFSHNNFTEKTFYTFQISTAKDIAGNDLNPSAIPNPFSFTITGDYVPPQISLTSPADTQANVQLDDDIIITFSEAMDTSSVGYTCLPDPGGWSPTWSNGDTQLTYSHNLFLNATSYTFTIISGKDIAGNNLVSGAISNPFSFATIGDVNGPQITATIPMDNEFNIAIDSNIMVIFNEAIDTSSLTYTCSPDPGGWSEIWSGGNTQVTFLHDPLEIGMSYTFQITAAKDISQNDLVAGPVPNPFSFTTQGDAVPPEIISTIPSNNEIDVEVDSDIIITFSEPIYTPSFNYFSTPDPGGWSEIWSNGNTIVTLSHDPFVDSTTYTFQVITAMDVTMNDLDPNAVANPWSFTTKGDLFAPEITSANPEHGEVNVNPTTPITITFSEAMDITTVEYSCSPNPGGWFESWSEGNTKLTLLHNPFEIETLYTYRITSGKDLAGNNISTSSLSLSWSFTTIFVESLIVVPSEITIPVNGTIVLIAWAYDTEGSPVFDITFTWETDNDLGEVSPQGKQAVTFKATSVTGICNVNVTVGYLSANSVITIETDEIVVPELKPEDEEPLNLWWFWFIILVFSILSLFNFWVAIRKQKPEPEDVPEQDESQDIQDNQEIDESLENTEEEPHFEELDEDIQEKTEDFPPPPPAQ
jgi:parallel beta-helix repeat protein